MALLLGGLTPSATAAVQDFVLTLNASDLGMDPAGLRDIVPEMQADIREHGGLGKALKQALADSEVSTTVDTTEWSNVDGTVDVTSGGAGLAVTIPAGEVSTAGWWTGFAATVIGWTTGYGLRVLCISGLTSTGVGVATIPLVCTPLQTTVTGIMTALMTHTFNRTLGTPAATRDIIIAGLLGLAGGFLWEKYLAPWAKENLAAAMRKVGTWIRSRVPWVNSWLGSGAAEGADALGEQLEELEDLLNEAMRDWGGLRTSLRVMPLGDSITYGVESSDGNGYRDELYDYLKASAPDVDFVGSVKAGSMSDRDNEGHPGDRIGEIAAFAYCTVPRYQPNVITLHAGTNDINQNYNLSQAPTRLKKLVNQALTHSPRAAVLVAKLIPTGKDGLQPRIDAYNAALPGIVEDLQSEGKHVLLVDMRRVLVSDGLENDAHPTDAGYAKMADAWYGAVLQANAKGWLQSPLPEQADAGCNPTESPIDDDPGTDSPIGSGETALGEGWRALGVIASGYGTRVGRTIIAELNGDQRADYLQVAADGHFRASVNTVGTPGQPDWVDVGTYAPAASDASTPIDVNGDEVRFADLNGDGRDDYLLAGSDSKVEAYINFPGSGDQLRFVRWGTVFDEESFSRDNLRFADVTGDRRDDILRVGAEGAVHVYQNMWDPNSPPISSESQPPDWGLWLNWAGGTRGSSLEAVRFADGDGDGRADYLQVGVDGSVHAFLNRGGGGNGSFEARYDWAHSSGYPRPYVQFADISGDGKADYLVVYDGGAVRAWLNRGGN
ncbi:GDSL-type esterase/lipase family protein [Nonomuraea angiospora]|uniref:Lysophospholipase L1-like esterase n=1 Tax=Nonomuraea angiospora TaxID=46172 RepID=A0ABR9MHG6_9ACTN|nr:GDSL-type esterase/lipase family protein [Nonomuraea angiospora]MBE1592371.1 lysophospholipase L1-like esterase [Nonomuraea angiospora]